MSRLLVLSVACWLWAGVASAADEPVTPKESVPLFNGKDLAGFTTWLKDAKRDDPKKVCGANGTWMSSVECQLAQGCVGDLIVIRGKDEKGETIPVQITSDVAFGPDKRPRWKEGGQKTVFTSRQLWWNKHDPDFKELLDTRGKDDVESPLGEFTKVECVCDGNTIIVIVNGTTVNKAYDVTPSAGKILLQCEGFELFVRKFEIHPLKK